MLWVRQLAPVTGQLYGVSRLVIIYTVSSAAGFLLSSLAGVPLTIGASAPLFGLFGALVWAGRKTGSSALGRQALMYAVILFAFGLFMPGIDNFAHLGGFVGGLGAAYLLNPLKREGQGDFLFAGVCLAATLASVVYSVLSV
jgi:rhomboid protease GluP